MVPLKIHHHQPNLPFRSACCSSHFPLAISLLTLHNDHFTPSSPDLLLHPLSAEDLTSYLTEKQVIGQNSLNSSPPDPHRHLSLHQPSPPSLLLLQGRPFHCRPASHHLCSRSRPLIFSGASFPPCSSSSHLQWQQQKPSSSPAPFCHHLVSFLFTSQIS